jgi:antitoxin component of MazEF toxin-antitoxin module
MYVRRLTLRSSGNNASITIPRDLCRHLNLVIGTQFDVTYENDRFVVDFSTGQRSRLFDSPDSNPFIGGFQPNEIEAKVSAPEPVEAA